MDGEQPPDFFQQFTDVTREIVPLLGARDLCNLSCVNRFFRDFICDEDWARVFLSRRQRIWIGPPSELTWKERYFYYKPCSSLEEATTVLAPVEERGVILVGGAEPIQTEDQVLYRCIRRVIGVPNLKDISVSVPFPKTMGRLWSVFVLASDMTFTNCTFASSSMASILAYGEEARVTLKGSTIENTNEAATALAHHGASIVLEECVLKGGGGVHARQSSSLLMLRCKVLEMKTNGISVENASSVRIESCEIYSNDGQGVKIERTTGADVISCDIHNNKFSGVYYEGSTGVIRNSRIYKNRDNAVHSLESSKVTATDAMLTVVEMHHHGVAAVDSVENSETIVEGCLISLNECGLFAFDHGKLSARNNEIVDNRVGIEIGLDGSVGTITGNTIRRSRTHALLVERRDSDPAPDFNAFMQLNMVALSGVRDTEDVATTVPLSMSLPPPSTGSDNADFVSSTRVRAVSPMVLQAIAQGLCSFKLTGKHFHRQEVWECNTCRLTKDRGVCKVCKETCHAGHDIGAMHIVGFYCDCGAEKFCDTLAHATSQRNLARVDVLGTL